MSAKNLNIKCPSCQTVYSVPAGKIGENGRKIRCSVCNHRFLVRLASRKTSPVPASEIASKPAPSPEQQTGFDSQNETPFDTASALESTDTTHIPSLHESLEMDDKPPVVSHEAAPLSADAGPVQEDVGDDSSVAADAFEALMGGEGTKAEEHTDFIFDAEESETPASDTSTGTHSSIENVDDDVSFGDVGVSLTLGSDESLSALSSMQEADADVTGAFLSSDFDEPEEKGSSGMVEFFVEDKEGEINRVETGPSETSISGDTLRGENPGDKIDRSIDRSDVDGTEDEPSEAEMTRRRAVLAAKVESLQSDEDVVGTSRYEMKGERPIYMEQAETGSKIEMPKFKAAPGEEASGEIELPAKVEASEDSGGTWKKPVKASKAKSSMLSSEADAAPSSGVLYNIILIILGVAGLSTNMMDLGVWKFDMIWSLVMLGMGAGGFILQNLSGVYISGFFSLFYAFGIFSHQLPLVAENQLQGLKHIVVFLLIALIFLAIYFLLISRKKGNVIVREGTGQAVASLACGASAVVLLGLNMILNLGTALGLSGIIYYGGLDLTIILQATLLSMAMALGLSAVKVHNDRINFAYIGFGLGVFTLIALYFTGTF